MKGFLAYLLLVLFLFSALPISPWMTSFAVQTQEENDVVTVYDFWKFSTGGPILDLKYISDVDGDTKPDVIVGSGDNNVYLLNGYNGSKIWSRITEGDIGSVDRIADITGDGVDDVVIGSEGGYVYCLDGNNGSEIWGWGPVDPVYKVQGVPDVTGDGFPDVVVGWHNQDIWSIYSGVRLLNGINGTEMWNVWRYEGSSTTLYADVTAIPDVTGDGKWDVIFAFQYDGLMLIDGTDGEELKQVKKVRTWAERQNRVYAVPDISGDGWPDIINLRTYWVNGSGFVYAISGPTLEDIWPLPKWFNGSSYNYGYTEDVGWFATYIPDITSDGRPEIVVTMLDSVYGLSGATGNDIWSQTLGDIGLSISSIPDISGDGVYDVIVGARDNKVYLISGEDGLHIADYQTIAPPLDGAVRTVSYIPDVTGDSLPEVLAGSNNTFVYCLTTSSTFPRPQIVSVNYPENINLGETAHIIIQGRNHGEESSETYLSASFPSNPSYVEITSTDANHAKVYRPGDSLWAGYGQYQIIAQYTLAEGWEAPWSAELQRYLSIDVKPEEAGAFTFYVKMTARYGYGDRWFADPRVNGTESSYKDQQDEHVYEYTINVKSSVEFWYQLLPVPYHSQGSTDWCLPASLAMILRYYGENVHVWDVADDLDIDRDSPIWGFGTIQSYLENYYPNLDSERKGWYYNLDEMLADILMSIDAKYPTILFIPSIFLLSQGGFTRSHAVVVVGYSSEGNTTLFINDPSGYLFELLEDIDEKYTPHKNNPIAAPVAWSDLKTLLFLPEILIVKGSAMPLQSTLYTKDWLGGVVSFHGEESKIGIYTIFGRDGIVWRAEEGHALELDSYDGLMIITYVANHLQSLEHYSVTITMDSDESAIQLIEIEEDVHNYTIWESHSLLQLADYIEESGNYTLRLQLKKGDQIYDEVVFPPIHYEFLGTPTVRSLSYNGEVGPEQYTTLTYRTTTSLPELTFSLNWSGSDLDLHIFDSEGRHVGMNYTTGEVDLQIPGATYGGSTAKPESIIIPNPNNEVYKIKIYGKQVDKEKELFSITISKGLLEQQWYQQHLYIIAIAMIIAAVLVGISLLRRATKMKTSGDKSI